jgi:hypothetical protein
MHIYFPYKITKIKRVMELGFLGSKKTGKLIRTLVHPADIAHKNTNVFGFFSFP